MNLGVYDMESIKIALAQLECKDGQPDHNLARIESTLAQYGESHDVLVFPESFVTGFPSREITRRLAEPLNGATVKELERLATRFNTTFAVGMAERDGKDVYNTTVLVAPNGLLFSYRKTHLWTGEALRVDAGNYFRVGRWNGIQVGLLICYDIEFPESARAVAQMGAELLLLTNGNMDPYGPAHRTVLQARAQENQMFVAMANRVGKQNTTRYVGESAVADPYGRVLAEAGHDEEILSVTLDLSLVQESRQKYDYLKERRVPIKVAMAEVTPAVTESRFD